VASDPSLRTRYRRALQKALSDALQVEFQGGKIEGPQADRDIGCVWWEGKRPQGRDGNNEENFYIVRLFKLFKQDQGGETPRVDQEEALELTAEALEDALASVLARPWLSTAVPDIDLSDAPDFFTVTEVSLNHELQYVEATLTAWMRNRTARGG
jgi:hypothetical protein